MPMASPLSFSEGRSTVTRLTAWSRPQSPFIGMWASQGLSEPKDMAKQVCGAHLCARLCSGAGARGPACVLTSAPGQLYEPADFLSASIFVSLNEL